MTIPTTPTTTKPASEACALLGRASEPSMQPRYTLSWRGNAEDSHLIVDTATKQVVEEFSPYHPGNAFRRALLRCRELNGKPAKCQCGSLYGEGSLEHNSNKELTCSYCGAPAI